MNKQPKASTLAALFGLFGSMVPFKIPYQPKTPKGGHSFYKERDFAPLPKTTPLSAPDETQINKAEDIEKMAAQAAEKARRYNVGKPRSKHLSTNPSKWAKAMRRVLREGQATHASLTSSGVPRRKDGSRLGLRKRRQMAKEMA